MPYDIAPLCPRIGYARTPPIKILTRLLWIDQNSVGSRVVRCFVLHPHLLRGTDANLQALQHCRVAVV